MLKGIDISHYQNLVDFGQVKASGIDIVYIKATEGKTYQDPNFRTYYDAARANGMSVGAYHFLRGNAVEDEVNNFLSVVGNLDFDCKLVIDAEVDLGGIEANSRQVRSFADALKAKGKQFVLYTGESFYNNNLDSSVKDIPLWVAKYSTTAPNVGKPFIGWQYTSSGNVNGIGGKVDLDNFEEEILIIKKKFYVGTGTFPSLEVANAALKKYFTDKGLWGKVKFYIESGYFNTEADAQTVVDAMDKDGLWSKVEVR